VLRVATYRLQETVGAESVILVTITDVPPHARRLLCNGYKHASMRSEDELSNVTLNQGDRSLIQAWIKVSVPTIHGIKTETACDSQALIQLQREYCDKRQCLRCRFGYEFLRGRTKIEGYRNMAIEPDLFAELY